MFINIINKKISFQIFINFKNFSFNYQRYKADIDESDSFQFIINIKTSKITFSHFSAAKHSACVPCKSAFIIIG